MVTTTDAPDITEQRKKWLEKLIGMMIAATAYVDWDNISDTAQQAIDDLGDPMHGIVDGDSWNSITRTAADQFTTNAQYYIDQHKGDLQGVDWKQYLVLVATAELQNAVAASTRQAAGQSGNRRLQIRRLTHPDATKTGPCDRCKQLEGDHNASDDDLWFTHPHCACTWEPIDASESSMLANARFQRPYSKAAAQYETVASDGYSQCRHCTNFLPPNGCTIVLGDIAPAGWCQFHQWRFGRALNAGAPAAAGTPSGFFRDEAGNVHPIFVSPGGVRQPSANAHEWHQKLTVAQGMALAAWSDYSSPMLKAAARGSLEKVGGHAVNNDLYRQLHEFNSAVHTAPQAEGQVYRGITALSDEQFAKLTRAKMLRTQSPTSFTTDISTAADFAVGTKRTDNTAMFIARRHNAGDITSMVNSAIEREAVVPQGSTYHVDRVSIEPRPLPATGKRANIYISFGKLGKTKPVELAGTLTPRGYFADSEGQLFPIYQDA